MDMASPCVVFTRSVIRLNCHVGEHWLKQPQNRALRGANQHILLLSIKEREKGKGRRI